MSNSSRQDVPLDFGRLRMVAEGKEAQAALFSLFFRMSEDFITTLENSRHNEAFPQWKSAAHNLKGTAANLGMSKLQQLCHEAEQAGDFTVEQRGDIVRQISDEIGYIKNYLHNNHPAFPNAET